MPMKPNLPANLGARYGLDIRCYTRTGPSLARDTDAEDEDRREHDAALLADERAEARADARARRGKYFDARRIP